MKKVIILLFVLIVLTGCSKNNDSSNKNDEKAKDNEIVDVSLENNDTDQYADTEEIDTDNINDDNDNVLDNNSNNNTTDELVDTSNIETEEDLVNYFSDLKDKIKEKLNKDTWENVKKSVMSALNTAYGFCFKGEEIGGYTLSELSDSSKEKILNIVFDIDTFIELKSPGYKESFKESYNTMIESAKKSLGLIKDKITDIFNSDE